MAQGIEQRIARLEKKIERQGASLAKVRGLLFGRKDEAPKARKPRKPRKALGRIPGTGPDGAGPLLPDGEGRMPGALPADDPHYGGAPKKRGRKKAGVEAESAGGEG